jgi:hypothetical protein
MSELARKGRATWSILKIILGCKIGNVHTCHFQQSTQHIQDSPYRWTSTRYLSHFQRPAFPIKTHGSFTLHTMHPLPFRENPYISEHYFQPMVKLCRMDSQLDTVMKTSLPPTLVERTQNLQKMSDESLPEAINICAHELIQAQTNQYPDLPAICSCKTKISLFLCFWGGLALFRLSFNSLS